MCVGVCTLIVKLYLQLNEINCASVSLSTSIVSLSVLASSVEGTLQLALK